MRTEAIFQPSIEDDDDHLGLIGFTIAQADAQVQFRNVNRNFWTLIIHMLDRTTFSSQRMFLNSAVWEHIKPEDFYFIFSLITKKIRYLFSQLNGGELNLVSVGFLLHVLYI